MNQSAEFGSLAGLRAVVTGASSGIGREIALEFARAGADVLVHANRSRESAEHVATEIRALGRTAWVQLADLGTSESLTAFIDRTFELTGGPHLWVNNAGVDLLTGEAKDWDYATRLQKLLDIDVRSSVLLGHEVGMRLKSLGRGCLLNIGWDQADRGMEGNSGELFAAAKNAIMGFTRSLAVSLAPEVRVNCIAPGWIKTAWGDQASDVWQSRVLRETPLQRWGLPEDIARLARFLCSPDASYLTGQVINANGGAIR